MSIKIIDISQPIHGKMPVYKNKAEKKPRIWLSRTLLEGARETKMELDLHSGTHLDGPNHMLTHAQSANEAIGMRFLFECQVIDLTDIPDAVTQNELKTKKINPDSFVLLKTKNSFDQNFNPVFVFLEKTGAQFLVDQKVAGVGIDALGIERAQPSHDTHIILFQNNILILEGLALKEVKAGNYRLVCAPLLIPGADAVPVRAFLMQEG